MIDIITFLQARYDEHEKIINEYMDAYPEWHNEEGDKWYGWRVRGKELVTNYGKIIIEGECGNCGSDESMEGPEFLAMIATSSPWKVLADLKSKRRILEEMSNSYLQTWTAAQTVLNALALPFADHPDYQQEWKRLL
jgi:hypothetical protein